MTTTTIDYTNIDATDDGADMVAAIKLEFQHAQADMVLKPNVAGAETISGAWTFSALATFSTKVEISAGSANVPLKVTLDSGGTADILQVYDDTDKIVYVDNTGNFLVRNRKIDVDVVDNVALLVSNDGTAILTVGATAGATMLIDGRIKLTNLPTGTGGLATGELWNDSGTIKIV